MTTTSSFKKYTESGIAPPLNILGILILAVAGSFVLGFLYNILIRFISFIYINVLVVFAFGYVLAYMSRGLNILFKIRSKTKAMFITAAIAILAVYIQWACFVYIFFVEDLSPIQDFKSIVNIIIHPELLVQLMPEINEFGTWTVSKTSINGGILWWLWLGEALLLIAIPLRLYMQFEIMPFSEADNRWYKKNRIDKDFEYIHLRRDFLELFAKSPVEGLNSLGKHDYSRYSRFYIYSDKNMRSFLIEIENVKLDHKGRKDYSEILPPSHIAFDQIKQIQTSFNIV